LEGTRGNPLKVDREKIAQVVPILLPGDKWSSVWDMSGTIKKTIAGILEAVKQKTGKVVSRNTFIVTAINRYIDHVMDSKDMDGLINKILEENDVYERKNLFGGRKDTEGDD